LRNFFKKKDEKKKKKKKQKKKEKKLPGMAAKRFVPSRQGESLRPCLAREDKFGVS